MRNTIYYTADLEKSRGQDIKRLKRQRQVRRNIAILSFSMVLILVLSVLFISFYSQAGNIDESVPVPQKYFRSIQIKKGDTLWSIANENMDTDYYKSASEYIEEVKAMNSLTSDLIVAGRYIIVPYYSTENIYLYN